MWECEECVKGQLKRQLNAIEDHGGTVFQIIESTRNDFVLIVWKRHQQQKMNIPAFGQLGRKR